MKNNLPQGTVCPCLGAIHMYKTDWPIKAEFHVKPPWEGGKKVYTNGPGHMTKMAATPIYDINLQKFSSPEPESL